MSVKIYNGIRIKKEDIDKLIKFYYNYCTSEIQNFVDNLMAADIDLKKVEAKSKFFKTLDAKATDKEKRIYLKTFWVLCLFMETIKEKTNFSNPSCSLAIYPYKDYHYIVYYLPSIKNLKKVCWPKYVEKYAYYNNTDRPKNVDSSDWKKRFKSWKSCGALDSSNRHRNRLIYEVVSENLSYDNNSLEFINRNLLSETSWAVYLDAYLHVLDK